MSAGIIALAGTNGAGKSSVGGAAFERAGARYFNPDRATRQIQEAHPELSLAQANSLGWQVGKQRLELAIRDRSAFTFETTLGGDTLPRLLRQAAEVMPVRMWYAALSSPELHLQRVAARVAKGGHDIPEAKIRARYTRSVQNLITLLPLLTELRVFDNSVEADPSAGLTPQPQLLLHLREGQVIAPASLGATPDWARPIVAAALSLSR